MASAHASEWDDDDALSGQWTERLQKALAGAGIASRRKCEELIRAGRVTVNGDVVTTLGTKVDLEADIVEVDGERVMPSERLVYMVLNKPAGFITTLVDPQGRPTVAQFIPRSAGRVFPIGRLDKDTTGVLVFTNDGDLAHRLMHPRYHVPKTYLATVDSVPTEEALDLLRAGIELDDGPTQPAEDVEVVVRTPGRAVVQLTIREGRKRQVRRMLSAVGYPVRALSRVRFGPVELGDLGEGERRPLTPPELAALRDAAGLPGGPL